MSEPQHGLNDPLKRPLGVRATPRESEVDRVRRETAMGGLVLSFCAFVFGTLVGGALVGALVAIF